MAVDEPTLNTQAVRFGVFDLDLKAGELRRNGFKVKLQEQPFQLLRLLLDRPGELVTHDVIIQTLWPNGTIVEFEHSVKTAVKKLRQALGDDADTPRYVETLPRRGYRFIYPINGVGAGVVPAPPPKEVPAVSKGETSTVTGHRRGVPLRRGLQALAALLVLVAVSTLVWFLLHRGPPPQPSAELMQKRLTFNSSDNAVRSSALSPDGKYVAYSDPAGIHVKLLSTSEERLIPRPAGVPASAFWDVGSWFPDGTQLLVNADEPGGHQSIWRVSVLGQSPRELREEALGHEVSPDGTHIAFTPAGTPSYPCEIWVMDSEGGNAQKLLALGGNDRLWWVHWSPDGQRLGYIRWRHTPDNDQTSIETCDLKGANRTVIVPGTDGWLVGLYWLRDGRKVYSRQESLEWIDYYDNLWQTEIDTHTGTPIGKPKRITQWAGSNLGELSASADGKRLVLQKFTSQQQVYVGELGAGGKSMKPPRRLTNGDGIDQPTAWTPDSKAVLFFSDRGGNGTWGVYKQEISQETAEPVVTGPQGVDAPRLSADDAWILYVEVPKTFLGPSRLMRIPVAGGVPRVVLETSNWLMHGCARAPTGLCTIEEASQDQKQLIITAFDPLKGRQKVLRTVDKDPTASYNFGLSPDGATGALSVGGGAEIHIRLLSLGGGSDREFFVKGWANLTGLDWALDGKGLYCGSVSPQSRSLLYVDLKGNARVLWQYKAAGGEIWGVPSPDGRYLAILGEVTGSNVWMLENF